MENFEGHAKKPELSLDDTDPVIKNKVGINAEIDERINDNAKLASERVALQKTYAENPTEALEEEIATIDRKIAEGHDIARKLIKENERRKADTGTWNDPLYFNGHAK